MPSGSDEVVMDSGAGAVTVTVALFDFEVSATEVATT